MPRAEIHDEPRMTCTGKQVKLDGHHFADAVSNEAAQVIVDCLEYAGSNDLPLECEERVSKLFA